MKKCALCICFVRYRYGENFTKPLPIGESSSAFSGSANRKVNVPEFSEFKLTMVMPINYAQWVRFAKICWSSVRQYILKKGAFKVAQMLKDPRLRKQGAVADFTFTGLGKGSRFLSIDLIFQAGDCLILTEHHKHIEYAG